MVYLRVAGLAQTHEVLPCVSAALGNGQNVVFLLLRGICLAKFPDDR